MDTTGTLALVALLLAIGTLIEAVMLNQLVKQIRQRLERVKRLQDLAAARR
ncbi:hypothetical protein Srot_2357 [Segniliparus rotundus DSM 44985]|uniref:Uncharacterized protein n=1 Tax=Segniliparus rotundus (strain ATCC BAA-972 / CDC 1076 / CIP 108378 / DSM 44985 / JCM 13578) TaxID=640132 RepID=D6ZAR9_SEGRD|nr:hypothetical protein [Segniliparus rotundus]ADG98805.1 hypothetical protein Srot_2357 [Segniliparus rotundus DSM 44985]